MKKAKKAAADMWWIIIGAVIALVVLIILIVIFTGKTGRLESGLSDCEGAGGDCVALGSCRAEGGTISGAFQCDQGSECCFSARALKKEFGASCTSDSECRSNICLAERTCAADVR